MARRQPMSRAARRELLQIVRSEPQQPPQRTEHVDALERQRQAERERARRWAALRRARQ